MSEDDDSVHDLVPIYLLDKDKKTVADGKLADIAPSILTLMGVDIPEEMDGEILMTDK